jgi:hypothetical protein
MKTDAGGNPIPGETPIDDVSGLLLLHVGTRKQLNQVEEENNPSLRQRRYLPKPRGRIVAASIL